MAAAAPCSGDGCRLAIGFHIDPASLWHFSQLRLLLTFSLTARYCVSSLTAIGHLRHSGIYASWNFEEIQLKMAWSKNIFYPRTIPCKMYQNYILLKIFIKVWGGVFVHFPASWESYMTPRQPIGVRRWRGSTLHPIGLPGSHIWLPAAGLCIFLAI